MKRKFSFKITPIVSYPPHYDQSDFATYISLLVESQWLPFLELLTAPFRTMFF